MKKYVSTLLILYATFSTHVVADNLYRENGFRSLVSDHKARQVGDSLTVLIYENSSAATSADTSTDKSDGVGAGFSSSSTSDKFLKFQLSNNFKGQGKSQRSGKLLAQITVTVHALDDNGELLVKGEQLLEVNNEKQQILLEGRVRPQDISDTNTVLSNRLANARISYVGDGILAEKQRPGLIGRFMTWLGLI